MIARIIKIVLSILFVFSLLSISAYGKVQRMGIAKGTYHLSPNQSTSVKAFCLDLDRDAPTASNTFGHVLSSSGGALVNLGGGHTIPLQEAITNA